MFVKAGNPRRDAGRSFVEAMMVARPLLVAGAGGLLVASLAFASPAPAGAATPSCQGVPPSAQRIAATTATYNAIEAKIAAGTSLRLRGFPDPTAQEDIVDYGVNDLWQKGIDGACVTVAYVVTNPDPGLAASLATYDTAMVLTQIQAASIAPASPT